MQINHRRYPIDLPCQSRSVNLQIAKTPPFELHYQSSANYIKKYKSKTIILNCQTTLIDITTGIASKTLFLSIEKSGEPNLSSIKPIGGVYLALSLAEVGKLTLDSPTPFIDKRVFLSASGEFCIFGSTGITVGKQLSAGSDIEFSGGASAVVAKYRTIDEMDDSILEIFDSIALGEIDIITESKEVV